MTAAEGFTLAGIVMVLPGAFRTLARPFARRWLLSGPVAGPACGALAVAGAASNGVGALLAGWRWIGYADLGVALAGLVLLTAARITKDAGREVKS